MKVGSAAKVYYYYLVFSNYGVDQNWKMKFISFFDCFKNCDRNDKI